MPQDLRDPPQTLTPPQTRMLTMWTRAWQQYYGVTPRGLIRTRNVVIPATRGLARRYGVKR